MKILAVLFDLDGTLLDTIEDIADSMNNVLQQMKFPLHNTEEYKYLVGLGMEKLVIDSLPEVYREQSIIDQALKDLQTEYKKNWDKKTKPYPEITRLLKELKIRGIKTAVLSNKEHNFTKACVKALLKDTHLDIIRGALLTVPKKPHPTAARQIADKLNIPVENFLYVGDTGVDMQTANAAGMYAVGVTWGFRTEEELLRNGARIIIHNPMELINLLSI